MLWDAAKTAIADTGKINLETKFKKAVKIIVEEENPPNPTKSHICFKKDYIKANGWCPIKIGTNQWGICSSSCHYINKVGQIICQCSHVR